jgi:hypothetical protein
MIMIDWMSVLFGISDPVSCMIAPPHPGSAQIEAGYSQHGWRRKGCSVRIGGFAAWHERAGTLLLQ